MILVEVKPVACLAKAINLAHIRQVALRRTGTRYELWAETDSGQAYLLGQADSEDGGFELWLRFVEAVRACGAGWVPPLTD